MEFALGKVAIAVTKTPTARLLPPDTSYRPRCKYCGGMMTVIAATQPAIEPGCELRTFECVCGYSLSVEVKSPNVALQVQ